MISRHFFLLTSQLLERTPFTLLFSSLKNDEFSSDDTIFIPYILVSLASTQQGHTSKAYLERQKKRKLFNLPYSKILVLLDPQKPPLLCSFPFFQAALFCVCYHLLKLGSVAQESTAQHSSLKPAQGFAWQMVECQKQWQGLGCHQWNENGAPVLFASIIIKVGNSHKLPSRLQLLPCHLSCL